MIPSITPPTDNLYKFISLFGLAIFLFAIYNLGIVYDKSAGNKMLIEDMKVQVQKKLYETTKLLHNDLSTDTSGTKFRPVMLSRQGEDLHKVEEIVEASALDPLTKIELQGEISKLNVSLNSLSKKFWTCFILIGSGFIVMVWGFWLWKRKEQNFRDEILRIEKDIKLNQKENHIAGPDNKSREAQIAMQATRIDD